MKGMVFTEFLELVEDRWSGHGRPLLDVSVLRPGGSYTAVGPYDHREMIALVGALSKATGLGWHFAVRALARCVAATGVLSACDERRPTTASTPTQEGRACLSLEAPSPAQACPAPEDVNPEALYSDCSVTVLEVTGPGTYHEGSSEHSGDASTSAWCCYPVVEALISTCLL